jgi:hypothetical protein
MMVLISNVQNQIIIRNAILHCQRGVLNCTQCQDAFKYKYMLIHFTLNPNEASPMLKHKGIFRTYRVDKIFDHLSDAKQYASEHQIPIEISMIDQDSILTQLEQKVRELGCHMDWYDDKLKIFSVYPVKETETGKILLPEIIYTLRPLNSKIQYALFYTEHYKVIHHEYSGINAKMNPILDNPKEYALEKVREIEKFISIISKFDK